MNVFVFDPSTTDCQMWHDLASAHGLRVSVYHAIERLSQVAAEAQVLVIDQLIAPHAFHASVIATSRQHPGLQVIATGANLRVDESVDLMRQGAALVLTKPLARSRLQAVWPEIAEQVQQMSALKEEYSRLDGQFSRLTNREKDVLNHILKGTSNKDTASLLCVSVRTIESRRAKVYRKLEAQSLAELVRRIDRLENLRKQFLAPGPVPGANHFTSNHPMSEVRRPLGSAIPRSTPTRLTAESGCAH